MASSSLLNPSEQSTLLLAACEFRSDRDNERFIAKVEKILISKLHKQDEIDRALALSPSASS